MTSNPLFGMRRSIVAALQVVGDRWSLLLVHDMSMGVCRFDDLSAGTGIPRSTLAQRLRAFEAHGLVRRVRYEHRPPRDEYRLTDRGVDLCALVTALAEWGARLDPPDDGADDGAGASADGAGAP